VAVPLVGFILIGVFLDKQFGTKPTFILGGLVLGMVVSFYSLYRLLKPFITSVKKNEFKQVKR